MESLHGGIRSDLLGAEPPHGGIGPVLLEVEPLHGATLPVLLEVELLKGAALVHLLGEVAKTARKCKIAVQVEKISLHCPTKSQIIRLIQLIPVRLIGETTAVQITRQLTPFHSDVVEVVEPLRNVISRK